jgi:hypothetical protein
VTLLGLPASIGLLRRKPDPTIGSFRCRLLGKLIPSRAAHFNRDYLSLHWCLDRLSIWQLKLLHMPFPDGFGLYLRALPFSDLCEIHRIDWLCKLPMTFDTD